MKTNKLYYWILGAVVAIFLVENGFILLNIRNKEKSHEAFAPQMQELVEYKAKSEINIRTLLGYLDTDGSSVRDVEVKCIRSAAGTEAGDTLSRPLSSLLGREKILFRFFQFSCTSCVTEQLASLKEAAEKVGPENILLLTDVLHGQIGKYLQREKIALPVYQLTRADETLLPCDKELLPYLLYIDGRGNVKTSVMLSPDTEKYGKNFCRSVVRRMEKKPAVVVN